MNKNKIIFAVIGMVLLLGFVFILKIVWGEKDTKKPTSSSDFTIWTLDSAESFNAFLGWFATFNPNYKDTKLNVVSFDNYSDYYMSLLWAFMTWRAPDLFVLNNSEGKYFDTQLYPASPEILDVDTFRKEYDLIFSQDLIQWFEVDGKTTEFLRGIPLGYQPLGMFYNFRILRGENLSTWAYMNDLVSRFAQNGESVLWIGNGSFVEHITAIIPQFLLQDGITSIDSPTSAMSSLSRYQIYGDETLDNKFNTLSQGLNVWENNIDLFSKWQVHIVFWYPSLLDQIDQKWFNSAFLRGGTFPMFSEGSGSVVVDYNYFVINKNNKNMPLALDVMRYFASPEGQKKYLETVPYRLPSRLSLLPARLEEPLKDGYSMKYKDFYNADFEYVSFWKWNVSMFENEVKKTLDDRVNWVVLFENFRKRVWCISKKMVTWENLTVSCDAK